MTGNKRFTVPDKYQFSHSKVQLNGEPLTNDELVRILNTNDGAFLENFNLKKENKELKQQIKEYSNMKGDLIRVNTRLVRRLAEFNISYEDIVGD